MSAAFPRAVCCCAAALAAAFGASSAALAQAAPSDDARADALFFEGNALFEQGKTGEACRKLEESVAIRRRGGVLLNLALCRETAGDFVGAITAFEETEQLATAEGRAARAEVAKKHLAALRSKVAWISIKLMPGDPPEGLRIRVAGAEIAREKWTGLLPVKPGPVDLVAEVPGKPAFTAHLTEAVAGETHEIAIPPWPEEKRPDVAPPKEKQPFVPPPPARLPDKGPVVHPLSHEWQWGALARVDIDPIFPGARVAVGATFGLGSRVEVGLSFLIGPNSGAELHATFFVLDKHVVKPLFQLGLPAFIVDDRLYAGFRGGAGALWDLNRHFGVVGLIGGAYFPGVPPDVSNGSLLLSVGAQGRL